MIFCSKIEDFDFSQSDRRVILGIQRGFPGVIFALERCSNAPMASQLMTLGEYKVDESIEDRSTMPCLLESLMQLGGQIPPLRFVRCLSSTAV